MKKNRSSLTPLIHSQSFGLAASFLGHFLKIAGIIAYISSWTVVMFSFLVVLFPEDFNSFNIPLQNHRLVLRVLYFLMVFFVFGYIFGKSPTLYRRGQQYHALKNSIDLTDKAFSFQKKEDRVIIRLNSSPSKEFWIGKSILYLRSFSDDIEKPPTLLKDNTTEELLTKILTEFGHLVCIGNPREFLPPPGASRLYYRSQDDGWKKIIIGLLPISEIIILRPGVTGGLSWEIQQLRNFAPPEKILCIFPCLDGKLKKSVEIINSTFNTDIRHYLFLQQLEERYDETVEDMILGFVIAFDKEWQAYVYPIQNLQKGLFMKHFVGEHNALRLALKPIFESRGICWQSPMRLFSILKEFGLVLAIPSTIYVIYLLYSKLIT